MIKRLVFVVSSMLISLLSMGSDGFPSQWPSPSSTVTSGYGYRIHPNYGIPKWHNGIDISTNGASKLKAVISGNIQRIDPDDGKSGNRIKFGNWQYLHLPNTGNPSDWEFGPAKGWDGRTYTKPVYYFAIQIGTTKIYYSTNSRIEISRGNGITEEKDARTSITESDYIAYAGNTGTGTGIHLHLINYNGGDPTKSPLIDLYRARTNDPDGYNPPQNGGIPNVSNLSYDDVTGMISAKVDAGNDKDMNKFSLMINDRTNHEISFYPRNNARDNNISDGTKTGLKPLDTSTKAHIYYYTWAAGRCNGEAGAFNIALLASDVQNKTGSASINVGAEPPYNYPGCDHPDDNYSVSDTLDLPPDEEYTGDPIWIAPRVGVFKDGLVSNNALLLNKAKQRFGFTPTNISAHTLTDSDLLVIPSGGLHSLWNSDFFKKGLEDYVKAGGNVVVFAQQHGYEYSALPTPDGKPITAYGWTEDQACQNSSSYIDTYHQVLSSLSKATPSINVDGYFTSWPENATVLLRRTANGQPAAVMYQYGSGYVIATDFFSDFGYGSGQASSEEIALIRDIITWAKKPAQLPEIKPGETATLQLAITNNTETDAASVKISTYDPDRKNVVSEQTISQAIPAGQSAEIPVSYASASTSALGIYHVDYSLIDANGETIWPRVKMDAARLAVSNPPAAWTPGKDIWFTVTTKNQQVLYNTPFDYTFHIYNNTDETKTLKINTHLRHTWRDREWSVVANPHGETTLSGTDLFIDDRYMYETMEAHLYDGSGSELGNYMLSFKGAYPSVDLGVLTDKTLYGTDTTMTINTTLRNRIAHDWQGALMVSVYDPEYNKIFEETKTIAFSPYDAQNIMTSFTLPAVATRGMYTVSADVKYGTRSISYAYSEFEVAKSQIPVTPNLPSAFASGSNTLSFALNNTGRIGVSSGILDVSLKDPEGLVLYSGSLPFTLAVGESKALNIPVSIPSPRFGSYTLTFTQSDETKTGRSSTMTISNNVDISSSLDRSSYRVRETANLSVNLANNGKFNFENASLTISVPDVNYTDTKTINIGQGQALSLQYAVFIPSNSTSGQHPINITLKLPSGSVSSSLINLYVPSSSLNAPIDMVGLDGSKLNYSIANTGGIDAVFDYSIYLRDATGLNVYEETSSAVVQAGGIKPFSFNVPSGILDGFYDFMLEYKDRNNLRTGSVIRGIRISGVGATLSVKTDRDVYLSSENITGTANVAVQGTDVAGELNQKIIYRSPAVAEEKWETYTNPVSFAGPKLVDNNGAIWFKGMQGLVKYDGQSWQAFYKTNSGLPSNSIYSIGKDQQGNIWVITAKGVVKYNGQSWTNFDIQGSGVSLYSLTSIAFDKSGNIWFGTNSNGLLKFNGQTWTAYTTANGLPSNAVSGLHIDSNDVLWLICGGVTRFNGQTFTIYNTSNSGLKSNSINKITRDGSNRIWVATYGGGISRFDGTSWTSYTTTNSGISDNYIYDITFDNSNAAWIATSSKGVVKFNGINWVSYTTSNSNILSNTTNSILADAGNRIWVSNPGQYFDNGLSMFDGTNWKRYTNAGTLAHNYVNGIAEDKFGNMWFATAYGLSKFSVNNTWMIYNSQNSCFGSDSFYDVKFETDNTMWVTTSAGVVRYDGANCQIFTKNNSGLPGYVTHITIEPNGTKWFISYDYGLVSYDGTNWRIYNTSNSGLPINYVESLNIDSKGNKWIATWGGGLVKFDGTAWTVYNTSNSPLPSNGLEYAAVDKLDRVWVTSTWGFDGVYVFDGENWVSYTPSNSGLKANDIRYIAFDKDNNAWMGGSWSYKTWVTKFDGHNWTTYDSSNSGLLYPYINPIFIDSKNNKWFANDYWYSTFLGGVNKFTEAKSIAAEEVVWQSTTPIDQPANTNQNYTSIVGSLNVDGKLYLQAELKSSTGQTIATSEHPFYVIKGNVALMFRTDKKYYRPGDTITISGEVVNKGTADASDLSIIIKKGGASSIYSETATVAAGGSHAFTVTTIAGDVGTVDLSGILSQNGTILTTVAEQYEVVNPAISVTLTAPDIVGSDYFDLVLEFNNSGKVDSTMQFAVNGLNITPVTVPAGETKAVPARQKITGDTAYTINLTGDVVQTFTKTVKSGLSASVAIPPLPVNSEGKVAVPLTITNTGLEGEYQVNYAVYSGSTAVSAQSKTYYIQKAGSISDTVYFDLKAGNYTVTVSSNIQGFQSSYISLRVLKETDVAITNNIGNQKADGLIPVTVNLTNSGYDTFSGTIRVSVINAQGITVWSGEAIIDNVKQLETGAIAININPAGIIPGDYTLKAVLYNNSGQQLSVQSTQLTIKGPILQITQLPAYATFTAGQEGSLAFKVKNTGNQDGEMGLNLKVMDVLDHTRIEWLKPGEEKEISFAFLLPEDLEEKDYFAEYKLSAASGQQLAAGQIKFHVAGVNISVDAALDKQNYSVGETAHLTIVVNQQSAVGSQNLFARVNYNGYEEQKAFTLTSASTLTFDVPLSQITGEKLFYGIYHQSGRSIHLNSMYVYKAGDVINITTDKQVYTPGETVIVTVGSQHSTVSCQMTLTGPGNYSETFAFSGSATKSITLPAIMTAGTYQISGQLSVAGGQSYTAAHPIDVNGIQVKIKEATLDKAKYAATDTMNLSLNIESNKDMAATLKTWVVDPSGKYTPTGETPVPLTSSEPLLFTSNVSLLTSSMGIHRLVYGIYSNDLLLSSGSEAFDVGDAVLLGMTSGKADYATITEPVNLTLSLYGGTTATVDIYVDGQSVKTETIALSGFETQIISLEPAAFSPGMHAIKVVLTADGLTSVKETSIIYGSDLPDLTITVGSQESGVRSKTAQIIARVTNQGKTASGATDVALSDGDPARGGVPITSLNIPSLESGASNIVIYDWNVMGKAGRHTIYAVADASQTVAEFNESNNTMTVAMEVPELIFNVATTSTSYEANQDVGIAETITNLTAGNIYTDAVVTTTIKDQGGSTLTTLTNTIPALAPGEASYANSWNTASNRPGNYTVIAEAGTGGGTPPVQGLAAFEILPTVSAFGDMTLSSSEVIQGFPLDVNYTLTNNGNVDIANGELKVELKGKTSGISSTLTTATLDYLAVLAAKTGSTAIEKVDADPGEYTLSLTLTAGGKTINIASKDLIVKPPLKVTKAISTMPRVLVWTQSGDSPDSTALQAGKSGTVPSRGEAKGTNELIAIDALTKLGAYYRIVHTEAEFIEGLRSGYYNTYALLNINKPTTDGLTSELVERVNGGDTLILTGNSNMDDVKVSEVTGTKFIGYMTDGVRTTAVGVPLYEQPVSFTLSGKVQKVSITSNAAQIIGTVAEYPSVIVNQYGKGKGVLLTFDIGKAADAANDTATYSALFGRLIGYAAPIEIRLVPESIVPIEITVESLGSAFDLRVVEKADSRFTLLDTTGNGTIDRVNNIITWDTHLGGNQTLRSTYLACLPMFRSAFSTEAEVYYQSKGEYRLYNAYALSVELTEGVADLQNNILNAISLLSVSKEQQGIKAGIARDYQALIVRTSVARKEIEKDIHDLLKTTEDLKKLGADISEIRQGLNKLLAILQRRWAVTR